MHRVRLFKKANVIAGPSRMSQRAAINITISLGYLLGYMQKEACFSLIYCTSSLVYHLPIGANCKD